MTLKKGHLAIDVNECFDSLCQSNLLCVFYACNHVIVLLPNLAGTLLKKRFFIHMTLK